MRRALLLLGLFVLVLSALLILLVFRNQSSFTGSRVRNPDAYLLDFTAMNQTDKHSLALTEGDVLDVSFRIAKGSVSLEIEQEDGSFIYRGTKLDEGTFSVTAENSGTYVITITAKHAKGFLYIRKR